MKVMHTALLALSACVNVDVRVGDGLDGGVLVDPADAPPLPPDAELLPGQACQDLCPKPGPGRFMVCARIYDLETTAPLSGAPLRVSYYDALAFANDPTTSPIGEGAIDSTGCSVADSGGMVPPFSGFIVVAIDDAPGASDERLRTGVALASAPGRRTTTVAFSARRQTIATWSTQVGLPSPDLATRGLMATVFIDPKAAPVGPFPGAPVASVTFVQSGASKPAGSVFYFKETDPLGRTQVDPAALSTGANGTALFTGGPLTNYGGTGAEPNGCTWPETLGAPVPGSVFVQLGVADCS